MAELAHHAETLLSRVRDKEICCTGGYADLALRSSDMLKDLLTLAQDALGGELMQKPDQFHGLLDLLSAPEANGISADSEEMTFKPRLGDILVAEGVVDRKQVEEAAADQGKQPLGVALVQSQSATVAEVAKALRTQKRMEAGGRATDSTVRVRTDRLDKLIDMVGELVIAQSMLIQDETVVRGGHVELLKKVSHGGKLVRELQDLSMSMRMVPLRSTFQKMTRLVRDLSHKSGKQVNFCTEGEETEIDRNMVDVLNDPLVHIIRNSVDHGIELPDVRESAGKSRTGTIRLRAFHSGGNVVVELHDDGKGLDREKIRQKAIARGLLEEDRPLSESEIINLIFAPGFSTAEKVTDVSGRGVGMDVVKRNIERLHGKIEVASQPGQGCLLTMRVPLTLAITDGMLVKVGSEQYLLPTINIYISFRPEPSSLSTFMGRSEMVMLRGDLLPVFRLHRLFKVQGAIENPQEGLLVVIGEGEERCALLVDELLGQQQVVAKSLGAGIGRIPGVAGGAILGNGRVGLILDPAELSALARRDS
jgi:two-component system chemotaxis sensor kinase CheA